MNRVKILVDDHLEILTIGEEVFEAVDEGVFHIPEALLKSVWLSDLPKGVGIRVCTRVGGSTELQPTSPVIRHTSEGIFVADMELGFWDVDEKLADSSAVKDFLRRSVEQAVQALSPIKEAGRVRGLDTTFYEDIAYVSFDLVLPNQRVLDAESYLANLESAIYSYSFERLLFICHASEDKAFVDRLVAELDSRALGAWYDKREIVVGDSIVERVNEALKVVKFLIIVLSKQSVKKPWVVRELSSTLMRQLAQEGIRILPVLLEDCDIPPLLADIRYADFRTEFRNGLEDLLRGISRGAGGHNI